MSHVTRFSLFLESSHWLNITVNQLKSLETTLAGALRREQMAETTIKQLEAEKEQLNRLVFLGVFVNSFFIIFPYGDLEIVA